MNDIHSVENYINGIPKFSAKTTHENLRAVLELLGNPDKAYKELGWKAENGIKEMCADSWNWQKNNPEGYEE